MTSYYDFHCSTDNPNVAPQNYWLHSGLGLHLEYVKRSLLIGLGGQWPEIHWKGLCGLVSSPKSEHLGQGHKINLCWCKSIQVFTSISSEITIFVTVWSAALMCVKINSK